MMRRILILYILTFFFSLSCLLARAENKVCYAAGDIGLGGYYAVPANPSSSGNTSIKLLRSGPNKGRQVISWLATGLVSTGTSMQFYVTGTWAPWGAGALYETTCVNKSNCSPGIVSTGDPSNPVTYCIQNGVQITSNIVNNEFQSCIINSESFSSAPNLYGLYGLIAIKQANGSYSDPNTNSFWDVLPSNLFRTFQILPNAKGFATVSSTQYCSYSNGAAQAHCITDASIPIGLVYLKIIDTYYEDNSGYYNVYISSGATKPIGPIEETINALTNVINRSATQITTAVAADSSFGATARAMLMLYVAFTGIMFAMGMAEISAPEILMRLFKISLVVIATSPDYYNFYNTYIFSFIRNISTVFSALILNSTYNTSNPLLSAFSNVSSPLAAYDQIWTCITSASLNAKIISFLFYDFLFYYIIVLYLAILFIIIAVAKTVIIYLVATINICILICIFPILLVLILFKISKGFFDSWLKAFISCSLTILLIFASIAIIMSLLYGLIQTVFNYEICWQPVWRLNLGFGNLFSLYFWSPTDPGLSDGLVLGSVQQISAAHKITFVNVIALVIVALSFNQFVDQIPGIADNISGGKSGVKGGATALNKFASKANAFNPIAMGASLYQKKKQFESDNNLNKKDGGDDKKSRDKGETGGDKKPDG